MNSKKDFQRLLLDILNPLKPHYSENFARLYLGNTGTWYEKEAILMEAFSRPLWGLVPYWSGGGSDNSFDLIYQKGIAAGADPNNTEFWGNCHNRDQKFVEMSALAYGLLLAPQKLWEPLDDVAKDNLSNWLYTINEHEVCDSNWLFFRIFVNIALKSLKRRYSQENLENDLMRIDDFYLGGGWYEDGIGGQKDYYNAFVFHFFGLIYSFAANDETRAEIFRQRAFEFAKDYIYWFSEDGEAVPYGRSLIYRFAQIGFWGACLLAGVKPFSVGVIKGIITRNLRKWAQSNIFDNGNILTIGYKYQNLIMAEHYNSPGSPYWALMSFAVLALDDDHEFWSVQPQPLPILDKKKLVENANMLITHTNGNTTLYPASFCDNFGCGQIQPKYLKFAYSTKFGFNVPYTNLSVEEASPDSMLCFVYDGLVFTRRYTKSCRISKDELYIIWSPIKGIDVETKIIPTDTGHIRTHIISSEFDCIAFDCGFAVALDASTNTEVCMRKALVKNSFSKCEVRSKSQGMGTIINASPNTNIYFPNTIIPAIKHTLKKGTHSITAEICV
ncbi:MAG: DUF2264 domain-containing protein [Clostridia bacterium]|nr:DUF2264 domain-containing protein [Clostridia bacterium]